METPNSNTTRNINNTDEGKVLEIESRPNFMYQYLNVPVSLWKKYKETKEAGGSSGSFIQEMKIKSLYNYRKVLLNPFRD